jgi:lysophospholipase L1-like esterase
MKKLILIAMSLLLASSALAQEPVKDWAHTDRYAADNAAVTVRPKAVFMGDSITEQWWKDAAFFTDNNYQARGISGQTTAHMLVRFRSDVINLHPKYVAIMAGTNDIAGNNGLIAPDKIYENLVSMCELARANKIKVLLCSITPVNRYGWSKLMTEDPSEIIMGLNARLEAYAARTRGVTYVNYFDALKTPTNGIKAEYSPDGVHLTMEAYKIIEGIIKPYIK